ncbi:hypothetical protein NT2_17_00120 [Caenibius tardaugens NBRC 16725]|uniref:OLD protein-like TOPRIM domain-containing protein n=1 Tax=Caenibius tardaugens NBRC 16725 TaxID=1219035 RepID=U2YQ66_9SPHN|nr:TOPRIM nucleotidyl transferase/hydrolase domain-containing protein [Caenibius tardaugens]AZI35290.1 hypothetical protein EGO55_04395 [Caenibius tardaugens NBRC 16725]GAD51095.1 hypothetical protein NT2_17_00120 [Caenibius tardaugens NBRC 16725]
MRLPSDLLSVLIEHDAFRVCRLMRAAEFASFCKERNVNIDVTRLRRFERLGVFRPMMRIYKSDLTVKLERTADGLRHLGALEDGETWAGETRVEMAQFDPTTHYAANWREHGLIWAPGQGDWLHASSIDAEPQRHEAYYSRFQIYPLAHVVSALTLHVHLELAALPDGTVDPDWGHSLVAQCGDLAADTVRSFQTVHNDQTKAALAQVLANRFYFKTQSDGRRTTISQFQDWDWYDYARSWRPDSVLAAFEIDEEASKWSYERVDLDWSHVDPIAKWYSLARFVAVEKRKRLKGDALHALTIREMAEMFRLFHREAFGQDLKPLGEVGVHVIVRIPDVDPEDDPLRALEFVANDFGVNAKPQLVLFVEGETEQTVLPILYERLWSAPASRFGIEILSLGGVDNAAGGREAPFSAMWRLVDYLHHHQTMAFVLLDNEGLASRNVKNGLAKANSVHSRDRKATRRDMIKIWRTSFEFENFSDTELAGTLNRLAGKDCFARADLAHCRASMRAGPKKGQPLATLERLYAERTGDRLCKPDLGRLLVDLVFSATTRRKPENRPISRFLQRVGDRASLNHQPSTHEYWELNQASGYLGSLRPAGRVRKRKSAKQRRRG